MDYRLVELHEKILGIGLVWMLLFSIVIFPIIHYKKIIFLWKNDTFDDIQKMIISYLLVVLSIGFIACSVNLFKDIFYYCHPDYYLVVGDKK